MNALRLIPKKTILPILAATLTVPTLANTLITSTSENKDVVTLSNTATNKPEEKSRNNTQALNNKEKEQNENQTKQLIWNLILGGLGLYGLSTIGTAINASRNKNKFISELSNRIWFKDERIGEDRANEIFKDSFHFNYWGNIKENNTNVDYTQSDWFKI